MIGDLDSLLDAIPAHLLKAALERRRAADATPEDRAALVLATNSIAKRHGMSAKLILSNIRDARTVKARWDLYHLLRDRHGWSAAKIAMMCSHDRSRVYHAFKQAGHDSSQEPRP